MDHHHEPGPQNPIRGSIRLSKLPMPRAVASTDNLKLSARSQTAPTVHHDDPRKTSHIPRPMGPTTPLGENFNQSIRSRYGWGDKQAQSRSQSPVRDALRDVQSVALDTTPPGPDQHAPLFEDGNENPTTAQVGHKDSQRDQEASPTRSPTAPRPDSPTKRPFRPPGRLSPTKDMAALPPVVSPGEIYTPPKAFVKGQRSRIAKPLREPRRTASSIFDVPSKEGGRASPSKYSAQTMKVKPTYGQRTAKSSSSVSKPSLASIFKEPSSTPKPSAKLAVSGVGSPPALLKPRSRGENTIALSTPPKANTKSKRDAPLRQEATSDDDSLSTNSPKSSAALRESIAKAKAAKRKARKSAGTASVPSSETSTWPLDLVEEDFCIGGDNKGLLRTRIQRAVTSGQLNIAAMQLRQIPTEVIGMYDPENSTTNWAEMVDLTKLNAADNDIEDLDDTLFPDSTEPMQADSDEKGSQFGGLEVLDLHRNSLHRIPLGLRRMERMHTLNLSGNKLKNDVFHIIGQMPALTELMIGENLLEGVLELNKCNFEQLKVLDLHGNALQSIDAAGLPQLNSLRVLNLADNKLNTLPWQSLPTSTLAELNISKNRFSGVLLPSVMALDQLRTLDASFNEFQKLSDDDEPSLPSLRSLILTGNKFNDLPSFTKTIQLITLEVADNQISEMPQDLLILESLKTANFANNSIRFVVPEIATMDSLTSLNLVGNPLRKKKHLTMSTPELKLDLEKKLETTQPDQAAQNSQPNSTSAGQYRYTPSNGILDLSSSSLIDIPMSDINLSEPIHTLKLSNNDLTSFPTTLLTHPSLIYSLQSLDLSHNPSIHPTEYLTSEVFLPNLKSLYIVSTGLTSLDALTTFLRAPELKEVNISCHRLAGHVPWVRAWWPNVTTLLATDNWFTSVDVEGVRGLEVLDIRNNEIEALPPKLGLLGNHPDSKSKGPGSGRLRVLEVSGNRFRVPRVTVVEKGTEAVLKDLRRMVKSEEVSEEWRDLL